MLRLVLRPSPGGMTFGKLRVWARPIPGARYIVAVDNAMGRGSYDRADSSSIGVWLRLPGRRIRLVAKYRGRHDAARVGEMVACLGRAYGGWWNYETGSESGCAVVNIERNLHDLPHHYLVEMQRYPTEFCFIPRERKAKAQDGEKLQFYTEKGVATARYLADIWADYWNRGAVECPDKIMLDEIRTVTRDPKTDYLQTGGKDDAAMSIIACVTDAELAPVLDEPAAVAHPKRNDMRFDRRPGFVPAFRDDEDTGSWLRLYRG